MKTEKTELITYWGIDNFNRPVFKSLEYNNFFGCVSKLFSYQESESEVLKQVNESDLMFFGNKFNCEPNGGSTAGIKIVKHSELKNK
jgi:hypothetical protein